MEKKIDGRQKNLAPIGVVALDSAKHRSESGATESWLAQKNLLQKNKKGKNLWRILKRKI